MGSHDERKNPRRNPQQQTDTHLYVSVRKEACMKMILHLADVVKNDNLFSLFRLERNLNVIWDKKSTTSTYLFAKALVPSKSKFLLVFHALTVCDTTSFSAGNEIAKIL